MDAKPDTFVDSDVARVRERLDETRQQIGETVEALVYKTDVPARATDALQDGIAVAKENLAIASDVAADQAVEVAATILETVESAKETTADIAAVAQRNVPSALRENAIAIAIGIAIVAAIALLVRRRRSHSIIDESPEVEKARELVD